MANAKDNWVIESPRVMAVGEAKAFAINYTNIGTPASAGTCVAYDEDGTDVSSTVLTGSTSLSGSTVTLKTFTPATAQNYRIVSTVTISGNVCMGVLDVAVYAIAPAIGTISSGTYGAVTDVAAFIPRHASKAMNFDDTTNPTGVQVAKYLDQVSAILNTILGAYGFAIPVTDTDSKRVLDIFANQEVAALVEGINGSGRFGPGLGKGTPKGRWSVMMTDAMEFIEQMALGLERLGATRTYDALSGLGYRSTDEAGDTVPPLVQRKTFNDNAYRKDWDE